MNRIVSTLSRLLEPAERECVAGDLEELQVSAPVAAVNIFGLVIRRQFADWATWGPWVALFGVAGLSGSFLGGAVAQVQTGLFLQMRTYLHYGVGYEPGGVSFAQQIAYLVTATVAILLWSWAAGFVLERLSGRSLWITASLFYFVVRINWYIRLALAGSIIVRHELWMKVLVRLLPLDPLIILCLLALGFGVRSGRQGRSKQNELLVLASAGLTLVVLLAWMDSWSEAGFAHWSGTAYVASPFLYRAMPFLFAAWPLFSLLILNGRVKETKTIYI